MTDFAIYPRFDQIWEEALRSGHEAGNAVVPAPMVVQDTFTGHVYPPVMDGVCGFAWVNVKPGTSAFARWLKATGKAKTDSYYGGVTYWVSEYNQSMTRKEAHAQAMAEVLRKHNIQAYSQSRMD